MNSFSQNLLLRVYFFGGLILLVGLSILFSILNEAPQNYLDASKWVFGGIIASTIPIILSIGSVAGLTKKMYGSDFINKYLYAVINGVVLSVLTLVLFSIFIVLIYGDNTFEIYVLDNISIGVIVFPISILLCTLFSRVKR